MATKYPARRSIWIGPELKALMVLHGLDLGAPLDGFSPLVNRVAGRYSLMVADVMPTLSLAEWCIVMEACDGIFLGEARSAACLWANVAYAEGLGERWDADQPALVAKLRDLPLAGRFAVAEAVERFWSGDPAEDHATAVAKAVGKEHIG